MEMVNVTKARSDLFHILDDVVHGEPKCITGKTGSAVMVSIADWDGIQETLNIMSNKNLYKELEDRMKTPDSEYINELNW